MSTPDQIRAEYIATAATVAASWESDPNPNARHYGMAESLTDALAVAGLLPIGPDYRWVYKPNGDPLGYRERLLYTEWREVPAPCTGCGVTERECGTRPCGGCCAGCRHPLREVTE